MEEEKAFARAYLATDGREMNWVMIRALLASVADTAIVPLQDVLGLGGEARMNRPATLGGNWSWRFREEALGRRAAARLASSRGCTAASRDRTSLRAERPHAEELRHDPGQERERDRDEERAQEPDPVGAHHHDEPDAT